VIKKCENQIIACLENFIDKYCNYTKNWFCQMVAMGQDKISILQVLSSAITVVVILISVIRDFLP
jgi:hypothetical protein